MLTDLRAFAATEAICADCGFDSCLCRGVMVKPQEFPRHSISAFDRAGRLFKGYYEPGDVDAEIKWGIAVDVVSNWRAAHGFPLGRFREWLLQRATTIDAKANVAQRLKRLRSIHQKMNRPGRSWRLTQIQDIAGCRAIVRSIPMVQQLAHRLTTAKSQHRLVDADDYISAPQATGYRSHHLIYEFCSQKHPMFEGMFCEIQLRTPAQHAWATAVEVAGFFKGQDLKGGQGDADWLRFFALASGAIALREEAAPVPGTPDDRSELLEELLDLAKRLDVINWMGGFQYAPSITQSKRRKKNAFWYLLTLDIAAKMVTWDDFTIEETEEANELYSQREKAAVGNPNLQIVLVSADGLRGLKAAYPSFFADSEGFVKVLRMVMGLPAEK